MATAAWRRYGSAASVVAALLRTPWKRTTETKEEDMYEIEELLELVELAEYVAAEELGIIAAEVAEEVALG